MDLVTQGTEPRRPLRGANALARFYRGQRRAGPGLLFLDFDDVICINEPYGGYDLFQTEDLRPADLLERLWHPPAVHALMQIVLEHSPRIVITTSWLRLMEREGFESLFRMTGLDAVADALHERWEAPAQRDMTRLQAIERWLNMHYFGEPLVVLDDMVSGTGLKRSKLDSAGAVVWCQQGVGLHAGHLDQVRLALGN